MIDERTRALMVGAFYRALEKVGNVRGLLQDGQPFRLVAGELAAANAIARAATAGRLDADALAALRSYAPSRLRQELGFSHELTELEEP